MKNILDSQPLTRSEYFALMRLLQTLETEGGIPGSDQFDWQTIYNKINYQGSIATTKDPLRDDMVILAKSLKEVADQDYCDMIDITLNKPEALGWEIKVQKGIFGRPELEVHKEIAKKYGRHEAGMQAYQLIQVLLDPKNNPDSP